jgi:probable F420-dependent oxidoreductase
MNEETTLNFGIISVFPPAASALDKLRLAEEQSFDYFWVCDSHVIWNECYSLLGWLAGMSRSPRMRFGTMVTNPVSRDPITIASAFATLNQITDGRVVCGIGRGDSAVRVLNRKPATVAATENAATLIRHLGSGDPAMVDGSEVRIEWARSGPLQVYVAAYGPRMLQVAGRAGSGVILECADPHFIAWALEHVRRGATEAGRDPTDLSVVISTATYVSDDMSKARDKVRALGAVVGNHVAEVLRNVGPEGMLPELAAMVAQRGEYDYHQHVVSGAGHADYVSDEMIERLCIVGSAEQCAERLRGLGRLGVTHVNFYAQTDDFDEQMRIYGREIIPGLRAARTH